MLCVGLGVSPTNIGVRRAVIEACTECRTCGGWGVPDDTEMGSCSEAGSYLRLIDFVYHSTLGLRVIKKRREEEIPDEDWVDALKSPVRRRGGGCDEKPPRVTSRVFFRHGGG